MYPVCTLRGSNNLVEPLVEERLERPTNFELALNLKSAKALGLTIPPALRLRADPVIQ
jgi:hypothetical protein